MQLLLTSFDFNENTLRRVSCPSAQAQFRRQPVDERAKANALHGAADGHAQALRLIAKAYLSRCCRLALHSIFNFHAVQQDLLRVRVSHIRQRFDFRSRSFGDGAARRVNKVLK